VKRLAAALGPSLVAAVYHTLGASYRHRVSRPDRLEALLAGGPVVLALWHDQAFAGARFLERRLHRGGLPLVVIASQSRDGELVARLAAKLGVAVVRGSTSRGGRGAMLALHRALSKGRTSPLIAPDGPRGPRRVAQGGAVLLAQFGEVPLVPIAFAASRGAKLRSWDRMTIPPPLARVGVAIGEPRRVPRELDGAGLERERARLQQALDALEVEARAVVAGAGHGRPRAGAELEPRAAEGWHGKNSV
jgi:lysophospholipid acyltransferase (LPLAT)-like uncharacterized protein